VVLNLLICMQPRRSGDSLPPFTISLKERSRAYLVEDALHLEAVHVLRLPPRMGIAIKSCSGARFGRRLCWLSTALGNAA
jgi:hypothetical protein